MKRLLSVLVLCGIFLSSFFAQTANATIWKNPVTIQADSHQQGTHNYHKSLIFSEISSESEDSEQKFSPEIQFPDYQNIISENKYIKNTLKLFVFTYHSTNDILTSTPIFITNRAILI